MSSSHRLEESLSRRRTASHRTPTTADVAGFRHAQGLGFQCAQAVADEMAPGWTEGRTCRWMMDWLHDHGVRTMLHKPIVAIGPRSLAPDDQWGPPRGEGVTLGEGDVAILDCSPVVEGYTGDIAYTVSVGPHPELERAQHFLSELREQIPARFADPETARNVFEWVDEQIGAAGYENACRGYPSHILGHRVYHHGRFLSSSSWFLPERPFGWLASWHGPGFLLTTVRRLVLPEVLGPLHHGPKTGVWAIEPHIRVGAFGAKFEELLIVEPDRAYWLDDTSQKRLTIQS
jgi:hypothetical protein